MPVFGQAVQLPIVKAPKAAPRREREIGRAEADDGGDDEGKKRSEKQPHVSIRWR